jgi:RIO kinase 3
MVMDEELARTMQQEEEKLSEISYAGGMSSVHGGGTEGSTDNDQLLAQMLQLEFDKEHDRQLVAEENHFNKQSKVKISFENYRSLPNSYLYEQEDTDEDETEEYHNVIRKPRSTGRRKGPAPGHPSKHDAKFCGQKNVQNMEKFPPNFPIGDVCYDNPDFHLQNKVFNTLKEHSLREEKSSHRLHEKKEHSTQEHVMDPKTRLMLFKLVDNGTLSEVNGCISMGKEAAVYHAEGGELEDGTQVSKECAIKIYKTTLNRFFRRDKYIKDDYRFKDKFNKQNPRKIVKMWAEKEMFNLKRLHSYGIPCPQVVLLKKHVLVMSFIGKDQCPAPKLKECQLTSEQFKSAYHQCVQIMEKMYNDCRLIHADLNEFNMLWFEGRVYIIDVSQSVEPAHPHGLEFLLRDCRNVSSFFANKHVQETLPHQDLFNKITGLNIEAVNDQEFIAQIRAYTQKQQLLDVIHDKKEPYPFDYFFEATLKNRYLANDDDEQLDEDFNDDDEDEDEDDNDDSDTSDNEQ